MTITMSVEMPDSFSIELRSLLTGLLQRDVPKRLGCRSGRGAEELKSHPFFRGIDWRVVFLQRLSPPLIPARGEVNAADAFDIGSFDEEDTKHIKLTDADQELYRNFPVVVSERWQHEIAETIFDYINYEADKAEMKRKKQNKLGYQEEEEQSDCILHGYIKRLGGTFTATWLTRYVRLYPNRLELWSDSSGKLPELIFMDQIEEVCNDYVQIKNESCIVIKLYNHSKYVFTNSDEIGLKEWHVSLKAAHKDSLDMMTTMAEKATKIYGTEIPLKHMGKRRQQLQQEANNNSAIANLEQKIIQKELQASSATTIASSEITASLGIGKSVTENIDKEQQQLNQMDETSAKENQAPSTGAKRAAVSSATGSSTSQMGSASNQIDLVHETTTGLGLPRQTSVVSADKQSMHNKHHRSHHQHRSHHRHHQHHHHSSQGGQGSNSNQSQQHRHHHHHHHHHHPGVGSSSHKHHSTSGKSVLARSGTSIESRGNGGVQQASDALSQQPAFCSEQNQSEKKCSGQEINSESKETPTVGGSIVHEQTYSTNKPDSIGLLEQSTSHQCDDQTRLNYEAVTIEKSANDAQRQPGAVGGDGGETNCMISGPTGLEGAIRVEGDDDKKMKIKKKLSEHDISTKENNLSNSLDLSSSSSADSSSTADSSTASSHTGSGASICSSGSELVPKRDADKLRKSSEKITEKPVAIAATRASISSTAAENFTSQGGNGGELNERRLSSTSDFEAIKRDVKGLTNQDVSQHKKPETEMQRIELAVSLETISDQQEVLRDPSKRITSDNKQREQDLVDQYEKLNISNRKSSFGSSSIEDEPNN